jgi:hypothetical protein
MLIDKGGPINFSKLLDPPGLCIIKVPLLIERHIALNAFYVLMIFLNLFALQHFLLHGGTLLLHDLAPNPKLPINPNMR